MPLLFTSVFVFFMYCACFLALVAMGNMSCSLATFVFVAYYISYDKSIDIGFYLICLLAFVYFIISLLVFAFL